MLTIYRAIKQHSLLFTLLSVVITTPALQSPSIAQVIQPPQSQPTQLASAQAVTQQFITLLTQQKFEQARQYISPSGQSYWTAQDLQRVWQRLLDTVGPLNTIAQIRPSLSGNTYTVLVTGRFQGSTSDFVITLDSNQKVLAFDFPWLGGLQKNADAFVDAITTGDYGVARSYLSPHFKQTFLPETLKQRWEAVQAKMGTFKRRSASTLVRSSNSDVVLVNLEFEKGTSSFMIILNPLGDVIGVDFPQKHQR